MTLNNERKLGTTYLRHSSLGNSLGLVEHFQIKWGQQTVNSEVFLSLSEYE